MASGPDGDDDELVEIELEELPGEAIDPPRPVPPSPPSVPHGSAPHGAAAQGAAAQGAAPVADAAPAAEGEFDLADIVEVRQPIVEAAEANAGVDRTLFESEAAAAADPHRRAGLLLEVARLVSEGDPDGASAGGQRGVCGGSVPGGDVVSLRRSLAKSRAVAGAGRSARDRRRGIVAPRRRGPGGLHPRGPVGGARAFRW
jgi:hypothetical protein